MDEAKSANENLKPFCMQFRKDEANVVEPEPKVGNSDRKIFRHKNARRSMRRKKIVLKSVKDC
jgi:hypothetical protein